MSSQFSKGTRVSLISGGPVMAVKDISEFDQTVECQWFSGKKLETGRFAPETLVLVKDDAEGKKSS
jgi:uncharacterized protein YodC (DUF2158 family)